MCIVEPLNLLCMDTIGTQLSNKYKVFCIVRCSSYEKLRNVEFTSSMTFFNYKNKFNTSVTETQTTTPKRYNNTQVLDPMQVCTVYNTQYKISLKRTYKTDTASTRLYHSLYKVLQVVVCINDYAQYTIHNIVLLSTIQYHALTI